MTMDLPQRMDLSSLDIAAEKRDQLRRCLAAVFPEIMAEDKIDLDQLRRVLGEWVEPDRERFGLNWPGKAACMKVIQAPSVATLKPCREESVDWDTTGNVFIEGDNLEVLKLLQKAYFGKVKLIYIDPPYNTGKEFIYPDKYAETLDTYLEYTGQKDSGGRDFSTNTDTNGRFHSHWLNMMYPRLYLAKNLLSDDGVIAVSIDDHEMKNLICVMDDLFGRENFLATICVLSNPRGRQSEAIATSHEYVIAYARNSEKCALSGQQLTPEQLGEYKFDTPDGRKYRLRGLRHRGNESRRVDRPDMYFEIFVNQNTRRVSMEKSEEFNISVVPRKSTGEDGRWEWGPKTVQERLERLEAVYVQGRDEWDVYQREFLHDEDGGDERTTKWKTIWMDKEVNYQNGKTELKSLFGECPLDYPKPVALLSKIISGVIGDGDIVLDFFAGSATTGHAVFDLYRRDGKTRKFLLVQLPERTNRTDYYTIAEISKERLRRAGKAVRKSNGPIATGAGADFGFKAFKLDSSNFRAWGGRTTDTEQLEAQLSLHIDHVAAESSAEDILYELLLKDAFPLTETIQRLDLAGKEVFSIASGALLICLDKHLTQEVIDAMAEREPLRVICLDAGFQGNDQLKANAVQTFKARARTLETAIEFRTV